MGNILEDIVNEYNLFFLTGVDHTYHHSDLNENAGKSTIDLTLVRGLSNLHIRTRTFDLIKTQQMAIEKRKKEHTFQNK